MAIPEVASFVGGAALGAPFSEILRLLIVGINRVKDFNPLSQDLASTMERFVPVFKEIDSMQRGTGTGELIFLTKTMLRAEEMVRKCSCVQWYNIAMRAYYTQEIKEIFQDFLRFCQTDLHLLQHRNQLQCMRLLEGLTTKIDLPLSEEVTVYWLGRALRELKKVLFEDGVGTPVVYASSGYGKTTLVTKLCHDADVKGKFKHILFITVSKAPNRRLILQRLLEHTSCNANAFASNFESRLCIQQPLMQLTQSGSVLLVLDDVWPEEESFLEKFVIPLQNYKILVTSRFKFQSFGTTFHLEPFIDEDVKKLFIKFAPDPNCASCSKHDHSRQKILKGCNGLPLAMNDPCRETSITSSKVENVSQHAPHSCKKGKLIETEEGSFDPGYPSDSISESSSSAQKRCKMRREDESEPETPKEHSVKTEDAPMEVRKEPPVQTKYIGDSQKTGSSLRPDSDKPPMAFMCPISMEIMRDPHIAADGFTYEVEEIRTWLRNGRQTSPLTNARLASHHLTPNHALRSIIQDWLQQHPNYTDE